MKLSNPGGRIQIELSIDELLKIHAALRALRQELTDQTALKTTREIEDCEFLEIQIAQFLE